MHHSLAWRTYFCNQVRLCFISRSMQARTGSYKYKAYSINATQNSSKNIGSFWHSETMLRSKQLVDRLRSTHGSPSTLAHLYWRLPETERLQCQSFCAEINRPWQKSPNPVLPTEVWEQSLFVNLCSGNHKMIWEMANMIKQRRVKATSKVPSTDGINPSIYLLLMSSIVSSRSKEQIPLVFQLFREFSALSSSAAEVGLACKLLFSAAEFCEDFPLLFDMRLIYDGCIYGRTDIPKSVEWHYAGATLQILLNTGQYASAVEFLEDTLSISNIESIDQVYSVLPMIKFWDHACRAQDCRVLADSLEAYLMCPGTPAVASKNLMQYLSVGLARNNHKLVSVVYEALSKQNVSIASSVLAQVVDVFSNQGDVAQCMQTIEKHYLYLRGEKALTKDLALSLISAYCHRSIEMAGSEDTSWFSVLEVINSFSTRQQFQWHEVSDAVSFKLNNLALADENVQWAKQKDFFRIKKQHEARTAEFEARDADEIPPPDPNTLPLPKKATNQNVRLNDQGNVLSNMDVLQEFTFATMEYMQKQNFGSRTKQLIVNCMLSHINNYQNFSAAVRLLETLKRSEQLLLDSNSLEILFEAISRSPASVRCGFFMFRKAVHDGQELSQHQMECLVVSSLCNKQHNSLLEFYCHEFLLRGFSPSEYVCGRILSAKPDSGEAKTLARILKNCDGKSKAWIEEQWSLNNFQSSTVGLQMPEMYTTYADFDRRDCKILERVFESCYD